MLQFEYIICYTPLEIDSMVIYQYYMYLLLQQEVITCQELLPPPVLYQLGCQSQHFLLSFLK